MSATRHSTLHALVLRGTDVGETSRLVTLFTAEQGRLTVKARGVRSKRSRQANLLEPFTILEARVLIGEGREIHPFTDGTSLRTPDALRTDPVKAAVAAIWVELLDRVDCDPSDAPRIFDWVGEALDALAQSEEPRSLGLLLAWRLMGLLGHEPRLDRTIDTDAKPEPPLRFSLTLGGLVADPAKMEGDLAIVGLDVAVGRLIWRAGRMSPAELAVLRLTPAQRRRLLDLLERFCQFHLDLRLRSPRFLESLEDTA